LGSAGFRNPLWTVNMGISPTGAIGWTMEENADAVEGESYRLLARGEDFRVGISKERPVEGPLVTSMEFLVRLFRTGKLLEPGDMERASELVNRLTGRGYSVYFQEDGWISCEKTVGNADVEGEACYLHGLLEGR
jgi:hypothetical protein